MKKLIFSALALAVLASAADARGRRGCSWCNSAPAQAWTPAAAVVMQAPVVATGGVQPTQTASPIVAQATANGCAGGVCQPTRTVRGRR